jgi:hypothetical protein
MRSVIRMIALSVALFAAVSVVAKKEYPITLTVEEGKNETAEHGSASFRFSGANAGGGWGHRVTKHIYAIGSDGNVYDLVPKDQRDQILPGNYPARLEKRDIVLCVPKPKSGTYEVKMIVVDVKRADSK